MVGKGADAVEMDVQTTRDGVQVIYHDAYFRYRGKKRYITRCTLAQLRTMKPSICTLDEALEVVAAHNLDLYLELKNSADAAACVRAVKRRGLAKRTMYISFNQERLADVHRQDSSAKTILVFRNVPKNLSSLVSRLGLYGVGPTYACVTQARMDKWHAMGLIVDVWSVNEIMTIKAMRDMGADVSTCNHPVDVLKAIREAAV